MKQRIQGIYHMLNLYQYYTEPESLDEYSRMQSIVKHFNKPSWFGEPRNPEVEPYIKKSPSAAVDYAEEVIKDRWPEAEPYIMQDPTYAYVYTDRVINKDKPIPPIRWKEAEPIIMKNPLVAAHYAMNIIKGRWKEAEPYIAQNAMWARNYRDFLDTM